MTGQLRKKDLQRCEGIWRSMFTRSDDRLTLTECAGFGLVGNKKDGLLGMPTIPSFFRQ